MYGIEVWLHGFQNLACVCKALKTSTTTSPSISLIPLPCNDENGGSCTL